MKNTQNLYFPHIFLILASGIILLLSGCTKNGPQGDKKTSEKPLGPPTAQKLFLVRVSEAREKPLAAIRPFIGRLMEVKKVTISPEVGGILISIPVEEGDKVVGGETVIAEIDNIWTELTLEQSKTQIKLLEVQLQYQQTELERFKQLWQKNSISLSEMELQEMNVAQIQVQLEAAKLTQKEAGEKLKRSKIIAPFDGFVVAKYAETGQLLSPGTNIVDVISRGDIDAVILVSEAFINRIQIGDKIPLAVESLNEHLEGEVIAIVPYGPSGSRTFPVKLRLANLGEKLKVGMSLTAFVTISDSKSGIVVTKDAVLERPEGQTVWVAIPEPETKETAKVVSVPVKVEVRSTTEYLVVPETDTGKNLLVDAAQVVVEGAERLAQNQRVKIVEVNPEFFENLPAASGHEVSP